MVGKDINTKAGKGSVGAYVSNKNNSSESQTDVGVKASVTTPKVNNSTFNVTIKAGVTIEDKKK